MIKVLVVGQTPPPYHGQAIMIGELLRLSSPDLRLIPVRMDFSSEINEVGRIKARKLLRLFALICKIVRARIMHRPHILYYPPAGPNRVPVYRDMIILGLTRRLFPRTVFHYHAGGLSEFYPGMPALLKPLFRYAYFGADVAIRLSELNPEDGKALDARRDVVLPYGIPDLRPVRWTPPPEAAQGPLRILFVGMVCESKGIFVLLEAASNLAAKGLEFTVEIMGRFESAEFERVARDKVAKLGLQTRVNFLGVLSGDGKVAAFGRAGIFCFPTFYESETFGVVLLEAMCFGLPLVATQWRGLPSIVKEGENGFLAPVKDPEAVAAKLELLIRDPELRSAMGRKGRAMFEREFQLQAYHAGMAGVFSSL